MPDGHLILVGGALLAGVLAASLAATRLRVPGLVLFLVLGMGPAPDGIDRRGRAGRGCIP